MASCYKSFLQVGNADILPLQLIDDIDVVIIFTTAIEHASGKNGLKFFCNDCFQVICSERDGFVADEALVGILNICRSDWVARSDIDMETLSDIL